MKTKPPKARKSKSEPKKPVEIDLPHIVTVDVVLEGTNELIVDRFSDDAIEGLERAQGVKEKIKGGKPPKDPMRCFEQSKYKDESGKDAVPGAMIQSCLRNAAVCIDDLAKAEVSRALRVSSDWCTLTFKECYMRRDVGRNSGPGRQPDLRYRAAYRGWKVHLRVEFVEQHLSIGTVRALFMWAGTEIGLGNWRPSAPFNGGNKGTFRVASFKPVAEHLPQAAE